MKHLNEYITESILSSTGSGKDSVVKQWLFDNDFNNSTVKQNFNKIVMDKGRIDFGGEIHLEDLAEKVPDFIKFGKVRDFHSPDLKLISQEQLPTVAYSFNIKQPEVYDLDIETTAFCACYCTFSKFKNITIHRLKHDYFANTNCDILRIDLRGTNINEQLIKEIHCDDNIDYLTLENTPLARKILRTFRKMTDEELTEWCNRVFANMPKLKCIKPNEPNALYHDPETNTWTASR